MSSRTAIKLFLFLWLLIVLASQGGTRAVAQPQPEPSADEKAIREVEAAFVREYNQGDSKALAARFTEDAEVVEIEGDRDVGRGEIGNSSVDWIR